MPILVHVVKVTNFWFMLTMQCPGFRMQILNGFSLLSGYCFTKSVVWKQLENDNEPLWMLSGILNTSSSYF